MIGCLGYGLPAFGHFAGQQASVSPLNSIRCPWLRATNPSEATASMTVSRSEAAPKLSAMVASRGSTMPMASAMMAMTTIISRRVKAGDFEIAVGRRFTNRGSWGLAAGESVAVRRPLHIGASKSLTAGDRSYSQKSRSGDRSYEGGRYPISALMSSPPGWPSAPSEYRANGSSRPGSS